MARQATKKKRVKYQSIEIDVVRLTCPRQLVATRSCARTIDRLPGGPAGYTKYKVVLDDLVAAYCRPEGLVSREVGIKLFGGAGGELEIEEGEGDLAAQLAEAEVRASVAKLGSFSRTPGGSTRLRTPPRRKVTLALGSSPSQKCTLE